MREPFPLHEDETGGIRKAQSFIRILREEGACLFVKRGVDPDNFKRWIFEKFLMVIEGHFEVPASREEGQELGQDEIRGEKSPPLSQSGKPGLNLRVKLVTCIKEGDQCGGVEEDRGGVIFHHK